jgi:hypothetical protein
MNEIEQKTTDTDFAFEVDDMKTLELEYNGYKMDCVIIDTDQYVSLIHNYKVILTLWLPEEFVWYEEPSMFDIRVNWLAKYNINLRAVQRNLVLWCYTTAKRSWFEGDIRRAKKNLVHGIRYLLFAHQIFDNGSITDYQAATPFFNQVFNSTEENWEFYDELYKPLYAQMKKDLSDKTFNMVETLRKTQCYLSRDHYLENTKNGLYTIQYIRANGLTSLSRHFGIWVHPVTNVESSEDKVLVKLSRSTDMRKYEWSIVRECSGIIIELDKKTLEVELACLPLLKIVQYWQIEADSIDDYNIESLVVTKKYNGVSSCLYYYNNKWNLSHYEQRSEWCKSLASTVEPFETKFWRIWNEMGYLLPEKDFRKCFIFECVENDILLVGVRDLDTLNEEELEQYCKEYHWHKPERMSMVGIIKPSASRKRKVKKVPAKSTLSIFVDIHNNKHIRPLYDYANDIIEMNPRQYTGYVCRDSEFNRVNVESAICFFGPQLEPFFEIVDNNPTETIDSWHNDYAMVEIIRCVIGATSKKEYDDPVPALLLEYQPRYGPLYVQKYLKMKQVLEKVCDVIDELYYDIMRQYDNKTERVQLIKILEDRYPFKKTIPVFVMRDHNLSTSRKALLPRFLIETRVVYNMYLYYCEKFI